MVIMFANPRRATAKPFGRVRRREIPCDETEYLQEW